MHLQSSSVHCSWGRVFLVKLKLFLTCKLKPHTRKKYFIEKHNSKKYILHSMMCNYSMETQLEISFGSKVSCSGWFFFYRDHPRPPLPHTYNTSINWMLPVIRMNNITPYLYKKNVVTSNISLAKYLRIWLSLSCPCDFISPNTNQSNASYRWFYVDKVKDAS